MAFCSEGNPDARLYPRSPQYTSRALRAQRSQAACGNVVRSGIPGRSGPAPVEVTKRARSAAVRCAGSGCTCFTDGRAGADARPAAATTVPEPVRVVK